MGEYARREARYCAELHNRPYGYKGYDAKLLGQNHLGIESDYAACRDRRRPKFRNASTHT
jgi:hypothetical protein